MRLPPHSPFPRPRAGMTLVELLVVVTILGIVATLALGGAGELDARHRFEETARRGEAIRAAARRFVADTGRWPQVRGALVSSGGTTTESGTTIDASGYLAELCRRECFPDCVRYSAMSLTLDFDALFASGETARCPGLNATAYTAPTLHYGWRGPYLETTREKLYDGFGSEWLVQTDPDASLDASFEPVGSSGLGIGDSVLGLRSLGRDATRDTATLEQAEDRDTTFAFEATSVEATLHLRLFARDDSTSPSTWQLLQPVPAIAVWQDSHTYAADTLVRSEATASKLWRCVAAGTSGSAKPAFADTAADGTTLADGSCIWIAQPLPGRQRLSHRRVLLVCPRLQDADAIRSATAPGLSTVVDHAEYGTAASAFAQVDLTDDGGSASPGPLYAGPAKLAVYGYLLDASGATAPVPTRLGSGMLDIALQPGANRIDVYLTEDLSTAP